MGVLAELGIHQPGQDLRHLYRHLAAFRQLSLGHQRVNVPHPVELRRQEVRHVVVVSQSCPPLGLKSFGQLRQGQCLSGRCGRSDGLRQCRPQVQAPGARRQEARAVGRVLNRVRERNELFVLIEPAAEKLAHHHRGQAGSLRADDGQGVVPTAVRAVVVRLGEWRAVAGALLQVGRDVDRQQRVVPAV